MYNLLFISAARPRTVGVLFYNGNLLSNTGGMVTVNDYNVSFTNVQRNQSGNYTLAISNDAGTSNTTFTLSVQCKYLSIYHVIL